MRASAVALVHSMLVATVTVTGCGGGSDIIDPGTRPAVLVVTTSTSGPDPDQDGYTVDVDGANPRAIGANDSLVLADISPGTHTVNLAAVAANCLVANEAARSVEAAAGDTARVPFVIECATLSAIEVTVATTGLAQDVDGYTVSLDGLPAEAVATNDTVRFEGVAEGSHALSFSGTAANCSLTTANPINVTVSHGATTTVSLTVSCTVAGTIVFLAFVDAEVEDQGDVFAIASDGSGLRKLTNNTAQEGDAVISPDGTRIAFWQTGSGLFVMNKDGNGVNRILTETEFDAIPVWSPAGDKIAFVIPMTTDPVAGEYELQLHVVDADGSNHKLLSRAVDFSKPTWAPDGSRLAFRGKGADYRDNTHIYVIGADGAGLRQLTDLAGYQAYPAWSPDGGAIAFVNTPDPFVDRDQTVYDLYLLNLGDGGLEKLAQGFVPIWSPQGDRLLYLGGRFLEWDLFVISRDGSGQQNLTQRPLSSYDAAWSPDGRAIAFTAPITKAGQTHEELWAMNADGTGKTPITDFRDFGVFGPSWGP